MVNYISIGGKERPLAFGHAVAYHYETFTGGNYNELLITVGRELEAAGQAVQDDDLVRVATAMHVKPLTDLVFAGMKYAHRKEGIEIDFDAEDVAEWLFGDSEAISQCIAALMESTAKTKPEDAKKKIVPGTTARPGSTGKALSKRLR
jgi:hypothetical protein